MSSQVTGLRVASAVFALLAFGQLARLLIRPEIVVASHHLPLWPSVLALLILAGLSAWMWKLTRGKTEGP